MLTAYQGLVFYSPEDNLNCVVVHVGKTVSIIKVHPYKKGYVPNRIGNKDLEEILNQQGKAPKRIQYELVLNAYYSNTDNSIEWMKSKFYSLDSVMSNIDYFHPDNRWELGYYPACKLPTNYLPTPKQAGNALNVLWHCQSSRIPDEYWCKVLPVDEDETVVNFLVPDSENLVSFTYDLIEYGGCGYYTHTSFSSLYDLYSSVTTNACVLHSNADYLAIESEDDEMNNQFVLNTINNLIAQEIVEDNSPYLTQVPMYQTITGEEYIKVHQLDTTQTAVIKLPNAGDDTAYNIVQHDDCNDVVMEDGFFCSGDYLIRARLRYDYFKKWPNLIQAPCCKLPK